MTLDPDLFDALTFDCYGTLIDWESGILQTLRPLLDHHDLQVDDAVVLELFGSLESPIQSGPYLSYREVLQRVVDGFAEQLGFTLVDAERDALPDSVGRWPPFPDTTDALKLLGARYRLGIVSNIDDDLFAVTAGHLGVDFDCVVTAQQVGSYKPQAAHFHSALDRLGLPRERVLHVAQSLFHDVAPASALGFTTVWVNRQGGRRGGGATPGSGARPDLEVPDLATLAAILVP